jgi:hypothetical protein
VSWTRRWYRAASAVLLIAAGAHLTAHWRVYAATDSLDPALRAVRQAMQAYQLYAPAGVTLWTAFGGFSFAFGALLALIGTTHWVLGREADPLALRRHALRNALLCAVSALALALLHPLPQALLIFAAAALLFGLAAWPRPHDV